MSVNAELSSSSKVWVWAGNVQVGLSWQQHIANITERMPVCYTFCMWTVLLIHIALYQHDHSHDRMGGAPDASGPHQKLT